MIHITNLKRTFHNVKMSKGLIKILVVSVICVLLVSQTVIAWSFWDWIGGKKQQPTVTNAKVQVQTPQPKASPTIISNCGKQADEAKYYKKLSDGFQQQSKAWQKEYELAMIYARAQDRTASEITNLYNLCNDYVYPQCPIHAVRLYLECSKSMLPALFCSYSDIKAFNPSSYPPYKPKICDIASFDIPTPITVESSSGNEIRLSRITHRIIATNGDKFITKGDSAPSQDKYQPQLSDIRYIYCRE